MERRNFRDQGGFRAKLHRQSSRSFAWGFPLVMVLVVVFSCYASVAWGMKGTQFFIACITLIVTLIAARLLTIQRNAFQLGQLGFCAILTVGAAASAMGWLPQRMSQLPMLVAFVLLLLTIKRRPARMDYSLFLRATQGMLKAPAEADAAPLTRLDRRGLLGFARFLGSRFLAVNFSWKTRGLVLRLPPVRPSFLTDLAGLFTSPISRDCSHILLEWDGTVAAHCGDTDAADLAAVMPGKSGDLRETEIFVAEVIEQAWREFRGGNPAAAVRTLGESSESDVFVVPPARSRAARWGWVYMGAVLLLLMFSLFLQAWRPPLFSGLKPVKVTEAEVRAFLNDTTPNPDPKKSRLNSLTMGMPICMVLPPTNLFSSEGLQAMQNEIAAYGGVGSLKPGKKDAGLVFHGPWVERAVADGWIGWSDLGIQPAEAGDFLRTNRSKIYSPETWDHLLSRCESWSWVKQERFEVMRIRSDGVTQLRLLRAVNCLDLTDRVKLIQQIASVQVLSGTPPGQPPIHDWRDVRGLFFTPAWPALEDTYYSLAALEILGGLDKIDREACVRGILRVHLGKGYFDSPDSGGYNEYHIGGYASDTFSAFESLRILGALDRVKDLDRWQFRVDGRRKDTKAPVNWDVVEAWVCQQRFAEIMRERKANPKAPVRSLLQP